MLAAAACVAVAMGSLRDVNADFRAIARLTGGVWRGKLASGLPVELRFVQTERGKLIEGTGLVGDPGKPLLKIHTRIGLDTANNQIYYLDAHNTDTVYFGLVTTKSGMMVFDFHELTGGHGHYIADEQLDTPDNFSSTLYSLDAHGGRHKMHRMELIRQKQ